MNVFRKCLRKEFGQYRYRLYVVMCKEELKKHQGPEQTLSGELKIDTRQKVYQDMLRQLESMEAQELQIKTEHLMNALLKAFHIGRQFFLVTIFYVIASLVLMSLELDLLVTFISMILMTLCFSYKIYEFISNKYCYVDAYLVMVYKSVLEYVLSKRDVKAGI